MPSKADKGVVKSYPMVASRVLGSPLLIERSKLEAILQVLGPRMNFEVNLSAEEVHDYRRAEGGYKVNGNVATIEVVGTLIQRGDLFSEASGMMTYSAIQRRYDRAQADPDIKEIAMVYDTPGGEVAGAFDLAEHLFATRGKKKVTAIVSEFAASAGYLLASTADEIIIPRTGFVGSIGVVTAHADWSESMKKRGVAVTFVYAGDKKVDGNPYQPLPEAVRKEMQAEIDSIYKLFTSSVAKYRNIPEQSVVDTQAAMYMADEAIKTKLADRIGTHASELRSMVERTSGRLRKITSQKKAKSMSDETEITEDQLNQAKNTAKNEGKVLGATEERTRIKAILGSEEADGRKDLAEHLAFDTSMASEDAVKLLAKSAKSVETPKEEAKAEDSESDLSKLMKGHQPKVSTDGGKTEESADDVASRIVGHTRSKRPN